MSKKSLLQREAERRLQREVVRSVEHDKGSGLRGRHGESLQGGGEGKMVACVLAWLDLTEALESCTRLAGPL